MSAPLRLAEHPLHLGLGAVAVAQPAFASAGSASMAWYDDYAARHAADGAEGRLVSLHSFDAPWPMWEMHPAGEEVVLCITGAMTLIQECDGAERAISLGAGEYAINPRGVWHTADVAAPATALFITAGLGTEVRPRLPLR